MSNGRYDVCSCGFYGVMVPPKRVHKQEIHIFPTYFAFQGSYEDSRKTNYPAKGDRFGVTLVPLWGHFGYMVVALGHFGITVGSLWNHCGYMKVHFQKTLISPTDFNDFIKLWCELEVDLGLLWDLLWHMRVTLDPFWGHFGHIDVEWQV